MRKKIFFFLSPLLLFVFLFTAGCGKNSTRSGEDNIVNGSREAGSGSSSDGEDQGNDDADSEDKSDLISS